MLAEISADKDWMAEDVTMDPKEFGKVWRWWAKVKGLNLYTTAILEFAQIQNYVKVKLTVEMT